jgi:REP element-mobilizing transposase RayT
VTERFFRRNLPHLYFDEGIFFITAILHDPQRFPSRKNYNKANKDLDLKEFQNHFRSYDITLHENKSSVHYLGKKNARVLSEIIHSLDGKEYDLIAFTILSNHFHLVIRLLKDNSGISKIMQLIKGRSAYLINKSMNRVGKFWQIESYDRWIRDEKELYFVIKYILENPIKAGLVDVWYKWDFSFCKKEFLVK